MNIHELNTKAITNPAYVALDDGSDTYKLDLNAKLSTMQSSISGAESDIATAQADITLLQTNMGQAQGAISSAQGEIKDLQSDLNALSTQTSASIGNLQTEVDAVEDDVTDLKSDINLINEELYAYIELPVKASPNKWRLNESDGLCSTNANYKIIKYVVSAGDIIKIVSDDRFQFQNNASVPSSGANNRVGDTTYGVGTYVMEVPTGATYLIMSSPVSDSTASAYNAVFVSKNNDFFLKQLFQNGEITTNEVFNDFIRGDLASGGVVDAGALFRITNKTIHYADVPLCLSVKSGFRFGYMTYNSDGTYISWSGWSIYSYTIASGTYYRLLIARTTDRQAEMADIPTFASAVNISTAFSLNVKNIYEQSEDIVPVLIDGGPLNHANANTVSPQTVIKIPNGINALHAIYTGEFPRNSYIIWGVYGFTADAEGLDSIQANAFGYTVVNKEITVSANQRSINLLDYITESTKCISVAPWVYKEDGSRIVLRIADNQPYIRIHTSYISENAGTDNTEIVRKLSNARHIKGGSGTPLTLLHFSDLHADASAMSRILNDANDLNYDDAICTGDIVANTAEQIASWWNPSVLTCIGNHDSASYNSSTGYNWTALSMADRDAYYITPFKSGWGITHTNGTSYYYKDYTNQKVRLIVMDGMLYTNAGAEATAQTSWLENLLADAITNDLHVLIAIHAPHGGATAEACSFSRYNEGTRPTYGDCNTPQAVIDTVAAKITAGLKFIGYLVGHTHQDNVWDAEGDGKQLMYCITCAAVSQTAQWINSDQNRSVTEDAYNLVTIDTTNTLVKIIRGGGADIDDHMRTRKAICFDYSTGEKVGEVL